MTAERKAEQRKFTCAACGITHRPGIDNTLCPITIAAQKERGFVPSWESRESEKNDVASLEAEFKARLPLPTESEPEREWKVGDEAITRGRFRAKNERVRVELIGKDNIPGDWRVRPVGGGVWYLVRESELSPAPETPPCPYGEDADCAFHSHPAHETPSPEVGTTCKDLLQLADDHRRSAPLSVMVRDGALVILIGIDTLLTVAESGPEWPRLKVPDVDAFALALTNQIDHDEDETGRTPLMKLIDDSIRDLVEAADPSIDYDEDAMPEEVSR